MHRILTAKIILPVIIIGLFSCSSGTKSRQEDMTDQKTGEYKTDNTSKQERLTFNDYDTNRDSRISSNEYVAKQQEIFDKVDKNKSEEIDIKEFIVYWCSDTSLKKGVRDPTLGPIYREMDKNNDGDITYQECNAYWMKRFNDTDLNKNNKISRNGYNALMRDRFKSLLDGPDQDGHITNDQYNSFWPPMRP